MKLLLSILVMTVVTLPMVSSRAVMPVREDQDFIPPSGLLKRVAREARSNLKFLKTAAQDDGAKCRFEYCEELEGLKKALLAIIEHLTCPDAPEVTTESYSSYSNDLDLGIIDL